MFYQLEILSDYGNHRVQSPFVPAIGHEFVLYGVMYRVTGVRYDLSFPPQVILVKTEKIER